MKCAALLQFQASLRAHRQERGWSFAQMGKAIGCARQNAYELETSDRVPSIEREERVAAAFGLSRVEFLSCNAGP